MTTPTRRFLKKNLRIFFKPAARYPADPRAVFILALSVFSGITAMLIDAAPSTLNALLPGWGVTTWGALLLAGSAVTLAGMARQTDNGILTEQVGSVVVGVTTLFYSILAVYSIGWGAIQTVGIVAAWGFSCFVRWVQLQALVVQAVHLGQERTSDIAEGIADFEERDEERRSE